MATPTLAGGARESGAQHDTETLSIIHVNLAIKKSPA